MRALNLDFRSSMETGDGVGAKALPWGSRDLESSFPLIVSD